jgi:hypothetical protein
MAEGARLSRAALWLQFEIPQSRDLTRAPKAPHRSNGVRISGTSKPVVWRIRLGIR